MKRQLIIFTLFFLSACSESIKPIDTAVEDQILYIGNGTEPQDLDPHIVTGVPESKVLMALLEGLVIRNPEGPNPLPGVAEEAPLLVWAVISENPGFWALAGGGVVIGALLVSNVSLFLKTAKSPKVL